MTTISLNEIQGNFAGFLSRIQAGEIIVVTNNGRPVAEIKAVETNGLTERPYGLAAGQFKVPEDFNAPLPDSILKDFSGP